MRQENLEKSGKVDFDELRRENLDKDAVDFNELRRENLEIGNDGIGSFLAISLDQVAFIPVLASSPELTPLQ